MLGTSSLGTVPEHPARGARVPAREHLVLWLVAAGVLVVLAIRLYFARRVAFCGVPDSCSYLALAESLDTHRGFVEQFIADLQLEHLRLPLTGIEYWRPGTSFFLLLAHPFGGVTLHSSLVVTVLAGLVLALAAWRVARHGGADRRLAAISVLLCLVLPCVFDSSLAPDSGLFYAAAVAWFLALLTVRSQGYLADAGALVCASIAYLVRNDAILLIVPLVAVLGLRVWTAGAGARRGAGVGYCCLLAIGFVAAMVPMHLIDLHVLGKAFPDGTSRALFFNDLGDLSRYHLVNAATWRSLGVRRLLSMRVFTLVQTMYRIPFVLTGFGTLFLPFLLLRVRQDEDRDDAPLPELAGGGAFLLGLLFLYSVILPAIGVFSALRTYFGLLPLVSVLMVTGMARVARGRWPLLAAAVILFYLVIGITADARSTAESQKSQAADLAVARFLREHGAVPENAVILMNDPAQFAMTTGYRTVQVPIDGVEAIRDLGRELHATHVLLDLSRVEGTSGEVAAALHGREAVMMPMTSNLLVTLPDAPGPGSR